MTQEVRVMLQLTLDVDAALSKWEIEEKIKTFLNITSEQGIEVMMTDIIEIREEAEIYGNEESPEMEEYYKKYHIDKKRQTKLDL